MLPSYQSHIMICRCSLISTATVHSTQCSCLQSTATAAHFKHANNHQLVLALYTLQYGAQQQQQVVT